MSDTADFTPLDTLYGVKEIADYLRIKERTIEYWIEQGSKVGFPIKRIGRTIVARRSRLAAFIDQLDDDTKAA